jgi:predicted RNA-binding Zn ribbon-like protein
MSEINAVDPVPKPQPISPEELVEALRALRQRIPEYVQLPIGDAKSARTAANLNAEFKLAAINAVGASEPVSRAVGFTAAELLQTHADAGRWSAVVDELRAMLQGVVAANLTRRHRVGLASLQTYNITRQLVRHEDHSDLLPHLQEMKRLNRFGRRRHNAPAAAPHAPAPMPVPVPVPVVK